jgi:hypothetical protein
VLWALNMGHYIKGYSDVFSLHIVPSESFTRHELPALLETPLVDGHMKKKLAKVQEAYGMCMVWVCVWVWCVVHFYKDGSLIEGCADLDIRF